MKKKGTLLFICFIAFYTLVHTIRHLPDLSHGRLDWNGETTYLLSIIRIAADIAISYLFTLVPYLLCYYLYPQKKFLFIIIGVVVSLFGCFSLGFMWTKLIENEPVRLRDYLPQAVFLYVMYTIFGLVFYFIRYSRYKELQEKEILLQNKQSELSFLRSQINPHFLFNNLNNIYSLVYHQSEQSLNAIAGLSDLLRYMLYDTSETVPLIKELGYIEKYIELQQLRFETPTEILFKTDSNFEVINIPPFILIPFVENAFKHGDASTPGWLDLILTTEENYIHFSIINKKATNYADSTGGIGIGNVKRRLALLYPEGHKLEIKEDDKLFTVKLDLRYGK